MIEGDCMDDRHINWQPIETAPRKGPVLIYTPREEMITFPPDALKCCYVVASWRKTGWMCWHANTEYRNPTHWCALEAPGNNELSG